MNLALGPKLMVMQGVAYFVEWTAVGAAIGVLYKS